MSSMQKFAATLKTRELTIALIVSCVVLVSIIFLFPLLPAQIPLYYSLPLPEFSLAPKFMIFLPSLVGVLLCVFHAFVIQFIRPSDEVLNKLLVSATLFLVILLSIISIRTIALVL